MRISLYDQMCAYKQAVRSKKIFEIKEAVKKLAQKKMDQGFIRAHGPSFLYNMSIRNVFPRGSYPRCRALLL